MPDEKSYARITRHDLRRLLSIAREEREDFFSRHKEYAILYRKRVLCTALCEGAALHYTNGLTGIRTFDVYTFYAEHPEAPFPHWHEERYDFGSARKFGRLPESPASFRGRPVVLAGRSIDARPGVDPVAALQDYLARGRTPVARRLEAQAVVLLEPERLMGYIAWPTLLPARAVSATSS